MHGSEYKPPAFLGSEEDGVSTHKQSHTHTHTYTMRGDDDAGWLATC